MPEPEQPEGEKESPRSTAVGCALTAIGLLILVPSGLCAAMLLPSLIAGEGPNNLFFSPSDFYTFVFIAAVGAALVWAAGRKIRRDD